MDRREFFGWLARITASVGLAYALGGADEPSLYQPEALPEPDFKTRMNAGACHDHRLFRGEAPAIWRKEIFGY